MSRRKEPELRVKESPADRLETVRSQVLSLGVALDRLDDEQFYLRPLLLVPLRALMEKGQVRRLARDFNIQEPEVWVSRRSPVARCEELAGWNLPVPPRARSSNHLKFTAWLERKSFMYIKGRSLIRLSWTDFVKEWADTTGAHIVGSRPEYLELMSVHGVRESVSLADECLRQIALVVEDCYTVMLNNIPGQMIEPRQRDGHRDGVQFSSFAKENPYIDEQGVEHSGIFWGGSQVIRRLEIST